MSDDDDNPQRPSELPGMVQFKKSAVEVVGVPMVQGEIKLSDGTTLNVMLVIAGVARIDGLNDPGGNPLYELQSQIVVGVKHADRGPVQ